MRTLLFMAVDAADAVVFVVVDAAEAVVLLAPSVALLFNNDSKDKV